MSWICNCPGSNDCILNLFLYKRGAIYIHVHFPCDPNFPCKMTPAPPLKLIDLPGLDQRFMDDSMVSDLNLRSSQL